MNSAEIRRKFIDFFKEKGHHFVAAAPLVNKDDPTLMFVNSGMVQFKGILLGNQEAPYSRVVNSQPCLRVSGKHNDLEEVGLDTYHHTFFEMLGHWSFGDYFKEGAIGYAWELLTGVYHIPKDRLYATIFEGSQEDGLEEDHEAKALWQKYLPEEHILAGSKKDNFWEMGAQGPCGPCTEIHIDLRNDEERKSVAAHTLVNRDHPQVIEIGNWVFIQYNRLANGTLVRLPQQHIDTGIGFERLCMVLQGKQNTYDTDLFAPLIGWLEEKTGIKYGTNAQNDVAIRVVVDHLRALVFSISQGLLPSSQKAGYVIRRLLRRAVRYGYSFLSLESPFLYEMVPLLTKMMGDHYPLRTTQKELVEKTIHQEEVSFLRTLAQGVQHLTQFITELPQGEKKLSGEKAFTLYDRYGFPPDLTALMASEQGYTIDEEGFGRCITAQKARSKEAAHEEVGDWQFLPSPATEASKFVGYDHLSVATRLIQYRTLEKKGATYHQLVLAKTPFYPEGGGQVGDQGRLIFGEEEIEVLDTQRENELILHYTRKLPTHLGATCQAEVDAAKRSATMKNHTATHLLQAALRNQLGSHVQQRGSLVTPHVLRFDFEHGEKISPKTLHAVEREINRQVRANIARKEWRNIPLTEAKNMGATALFTEKYGEEVRAIAFDPVYSIELCGGTHVAATGEIGYCKIIAEKSIAAGVRRIEALTGAAAEAWIQQVEEDLTQIAQLCPGKELTRSVAQLLQEKKSLQKTLDKLQAQQIEREVTRIREKREQVQMEGSPIIEQVEVLNAESLKKLIFSLKKEGKESIMILYSKVAQEVALAIAVPPEKTALYKASDLLEKFSGHIQGKGGGSATFAFATGKQVRGISGLEAAARALWQ